MNRKQLIESWGKSPSTVSRLIADDDTEALNAYLEAFGVECFELESPDGETVVRVEYLNTGDTYALTLYRESFPPSSRPYICAKPGPWRVGSWGGVLEHWESKGYSQLCF